MASGSSVLNKSTTRLKSLQKPVKTKLNANEEARIARETRLNTAKNSQYTKCELEWDQFMNLRQPLSLEQQENNETYFDALENIEEPLSAAPEEEEEAEHIPTESSQQRQSSRQLADLVEFEELAPVVENTDKISYAAENNLDQNEEENDGNNKRIQWDRRVSITRFHKLRAPKEVSTINEAFRRTSMPDLNHQKKQNDNLKPIIRRPSNAQLAIESETVSEPQLSPTKYRVQVKRIFTIDNGEEDGELDIFNDVNEDVMQLPQRKRKRSKTK